MACPTVVQCSFHPILCWEHAAQATITTAALHLAIQIFFVRGGIDTLLIPVRIGGTERRCSLKNSGILVYALLWFMSHLLLSPFCFGMAGGLLLQRQKSSPSCENPRVRSIHPSAQIPKSRLSPSAYYSAYLPRRAGPPKFSTSLRFVSGCLARESRVSTMTWEKETRSNCCSFPQSALAAGRCPFSTVRCRPWIFLWFPFYSSRWFVSFGME